MAKKFLWDNAITAVINKHKKNNKEFAVAIQSFWDEVSNKQLLNSQFQIGDKVKLNFFKEGEVTGCKISKVVFTPGKVLYDVEVSSTYKDNSDEKWFTRVHSIDGCFISHSK